jgi:hypothetical protein
MEQVNEECFGSFKKYGIYSIKLLKLKKCGAIKCVIFLYQYVMRFV